MTATTFEMVLARMNTGDFRLEITDNVSRARVVTVELSPTAFADLLSAHSTGGSGEVYSDVAPHWGVDQQERKTVEFPFGRETFVADQAAMAAMLAGDGWTLVTDDKPNMHRINGGMYTGWAWRWVPRRSTVEVRS